MHHAYQKITIVVLFVFLVAAPLHSGNPSGVKCPPRQGVIILAGSDIVFLDKADSRVYLLDWPEAVLEHIGHNVTLVGHLAPWNPKMLVVHQIRR